MASKQPFKRFSRRNLFKVGGAFILAAGLGAKLVAPETARAEKSTEKSTAPRVTANQALKKLTDGNNRYVRGKAIHPHHNRNRLREIAPSQHPFAVVLGCADSRVSPEILFDRGLGDLFDIRVAGNILDDAILGSIEYAVAELGVPLIVVLGHERCGAVKAALEGKPVPGHIGNLVAAINPAVAKVKGQAGDPWENAVRANVKMVAEKLKNSPPILAGLVKAGKVKIVGARYDLDDGKVAIIA